MTAKPVLVETQGFVCTIIINRPDKRNAVDRETASALRDAFADFESDDKLRVAVLCGSGGHFCAGADLEAMGDPLRRNELSPEGGGPGPMGPTHLQLSKPVIAAVTGYAVAGGLELALLCDLRVAETAAVFGVFCRRWGVPLIDGGTVRLPRIVGQGRALDMILTGREVKADEALQMGLANRVVAVGNARKVAEGMAAEIARFPQQCMLTDRQSVYRQWNLGFTHALRQETVNAYPVVFEEGIEGADRFTKGAGRHGRFDP